MVGSSGASAPRILQMPSPDRLKPYPTVDAKNEVGWRRGGVLRKWLDDVVNDDWGNPTKRSLN